MQQPKLLRAQSLDLNLKIDEEDIITNIFNSLGSIGLTNFSEYDLDVILSDMINDRLRLQEFSLTIKS